MKKINYLLLGLAGLTMASCSQDDILDSQKGNGNYNVTVKLPADLGTRAVTMNSGLTANILYYAVYDTDGVLVETNKTTFTEEEGGALSTTVGFNLASGNSYKISFFAQAPGSEGVYKFDAEAKTMTVDYTKMTNVGNNQDDLYDCFINQLETGVIGSATTNTSIVLNRPIAQINWGTNDYTKTAVTQYYGSNLEFIQSNLQTTAYTTFNLFDNEVDKEQTTTVNLGEYTQPLQADGSVAGFPVGGYLYMAMQYVMVPADEETLLDLNLSVNNEADGNTFGGTITNDVQVSNAPVQANYRTNIYGALLTDNVDITVTKSPDWFGNYQLPQDMGEEVDGSNKGLYYNPDTKTYTILTPEGLEFYATNKATSSVGNTGLSGITVILGADLDMSNTTHTPFYLGGATLDGQGHTVSNLKVTASGKDNAGFVGYGVGKIQNINFTDANISGEFMAGVVIGNGIATHINNVSVSHSSVTSTPWKENGTTYDDGNNCGGIAGYLSSETSASITNCSVSEVTLTAYRKVGGIVGYANGACLVENNTVSNTTVTANQKIEGTYVETKPFEAGEICGGWTTNATVRNNTPISVSVTTISPEGTVTANVASQAALQAAVGTPDATINLQPGNYAPPTNVASGVTFKGTKNSVFVINQGTRADRYSNVTFEGITFNSTATAADTGFAHSENLTYKNCTLNGLFFDYSNGLLYDGCTFNQTGNNYCVSTYGANNITFSGCTFNTDGKAILAYTNVSGTKTLSVQNCKFYAKMPQNGDEPGDGKAAVQINGGNNDTMSPFDVTITNCTESGFSTNTTAGSGLWSVKPNRQAKVTVDNVVVFNNL